MTFLNSLGRACQRKSKGGWLADEACRNLRGWVCSQAGQSRGSDESLSISSLLSQTNGHFLVNLFLVICQMGCTNCMPMTLLSKTCNIKVSSTAMKPSTWSGILELAAVASVLYQPVRAVYSKRFGLATQIHGHMYQPLITAATHDNCHKLVQYSNHQLDLNGETYASTQTTLFLVLVYPVWWTQMLEKDVV